MKHLVVLFVLIVGLSVVSAYAHGGHQVMTQGQPLLGTSIYNLSSQWTDQNARDVALASLRGQPVVVVMAYTSCKDMCPLIVRNVQEIEGQLSSAQQAKIRFALFSFDSENDIPDRLREFASERKLNLSHWILLHGDGKDVQNLAATLGVKYRRISSGDYDHSNVITILDREGVIAYQQTSLQDNKQDIMDAIRRVLDEK